MARKQPESVLLDKIREHLMVLGTIKMIKIHGDAYTEMGTPDLIGCFMGRFFAVEVKVPGEDASIIQRTRLNQWARTGARVGVAHSTLEAMNIVTGFTMWEIDSDK